MNSHAISAPPSSPVSAPPPFPPSRRLCNERTCTFEIAANLSHVVEAWRVLHDAYVRARFIPPNPTGIHTVPQAVGPHALVMIARSRGQAVTTISAVGDNPKGLPLDAVYADELDAMRAHGAQLLEIGLFGDRRDIAHPVDRAFTSLFELMRYTFFFGLHTGVTDFVCGIPPRRVPLYTRCFGFQPLGEVKQYDTVQGEPVVLMHVRTEYLEAHSARHRAADLFMRNPLDAQTFAGRFDFAPEVVEGSPIDHFLRLSQKTAADAA